jgi:endonuclease/exonuclease/phosphatase family metal-dependent hydrolase
MTNRGPKRLEKLILSLMVLLTSSAEAQVEPRNARPAQATLEYSADNFPYFSFAELKDLSIDKPLSPELKTKLDSVLHGVIVGRDGAAAPQLPESRNIGQVLRVAEWNIERGEQFEHIAQTLAGSGVELQNAIGATASDAKKKQADKTALYARLTEEAKLLQTADILVLNEVDLGVTRSQYHDVSRELAKRLGMNYAWGVEFVEVDPLKLGTEKLSSKDVASDDTLAKNLNDDLKPDESRYKGLHGSAVLTRLPIAKAEMFRLPLCYDWFEKEVQRTAGLEKAKRFASDKIFLEKIEREIRRGDRMALLIRLKLADSPTGYVTVLDTHLEDKTKPDCRRRQMNAILETLKSVADPVILSGDFNTTGLDGNQISAKYIVTSKTTDYRWWVRQTLLFATPIPSLRLVKYFKNYTDPTTRDVKFIFDNKEAAMFSTTQKFVFADETRFDFRGMKDRSVNGREKRLANSNDRASKGFAYTFALPRDFKGVVGRSKLDWFFVKPATGGTQFAPYFGRTMMDLNRVFPEPTSDHAPILVDLRLKGD